VKNSVYLSLAATDAFQGSRDPRYKDAEARAAVLPAEPKQNQKNKNENAKNRNQKAEITAVPIPIPVLCNSCPCTTEITTVPGLF